mgnify:CR=1 FL=1
MIEPILAVEALLADISQAAAQQPDALHLWWLGQSGFLVAHGNTRIVLDPYLSDSLTAKYADTDKPHVRMTERVVDPAALRGVALVTSSHNHTDHLDADTLLPLFAANPDARLVLPSVNRAFAAGRLGWSQDDPRLTGIAEGRSATFAGVSVEGVPAAHEALSPEYLGFVVGIGPWRLYHSGDTIPYDGMEERLRPYGVDVALLPINGRAPERRVSGNLWGDEAARLAHAIGAGVAVPCHYEMFTFNTAPPDVFEATCRALGQPFRTLRAGERLTVAPHPC